MFRGIMSVLFIGFVIKGFGWIFIFMFIFLWNFIMCMGCDLFFLEVMVYVCVFKCFGFLNMVEYVCIFLGLICVEVIFVCFVFCMLRWKIY